MQKTTDIYARADSKKKWDAFEKVYVEMKPEKSKDKSWENDDTLLGWLKNLKKIVELLCKVILLSRSLNTTVLNLFYNVALHNLLLSIIKAL